MTEFHETCLRNPDLEESAEELGWNVSRATFLEAEDWGELKRKILEEREDAEVLVFLGGDEELNRKAASDSRVDVLLHPERGRKDSGVNHVTAEEASENNVAIGFEFQQLLTSSKKKSHVLAHWRRNLMLCEKYDAPYIITTGAEEKYDLRAPRDLASVIESLGYNGSDAVSRYPARIVERRSQTDEQVRPGVEPE